MTNPDGTDRLKSSLKRRFLRANPEEATDIGPSAATPGADADFASAPIGYGIHEPARDADDQPAFHEGRDDHPGGGDHGGSGGFSGGAPIRHVVQFKGKPVAVGLTWRLSGDVAQARQTAVEEAARIDSDLWCLKIEGEPQIGIGSSALGHRAAMPALGAEIASNLPAEWAGIFEIDGCFYVLSARSGAIERDSDIAFVDRADAVELFRDLCGRNVTKFYASPGLGDLGVPGIDEIDIEEVIERFVIKLEPLNQTGAMARRYGPYAAAAAALLVFVVGFPDQFTALRRMIGIGPTDKSIKVVVAPMPWTGQPKAIDTIERCIDAFGLIPLGAGGWEAKSAKCDGRSMTVNVKRDGSVTGKGAPIGWLTAWLGDQEAISDADGVLLKKPTLGKMSAAGADIVWAFAKPMPRWKEADHPKLGIEQERTRLWEGAERKFEKTTFTNGSANPYSKTAKMKISTDLSGARSYVELLTGKTTTVPSMVLDLKKFSVDLEVRFHEFVGVPKDADGKRYIRSPEPRTMETGPVPKPEA